MFYAKRFREVYDEITRDQEEKEGISNGGYWTLNLFLRFLGKELSNEEIRRLIDSLVYDNHKRLKEICADMLSKNKSRKRTDPNKT